MNARDEFLPPERPQWGMLIATSIELGFVVTFIYHRSIVGILLCVAYAWFSATWALFADL